MGSQLRKQILPLEEDVIQNARLFSFEMAAYILEYGSDVSFGKNVSVFQAPFRTVSINSFYLRGTEIDKIQKDDAANTIYIERLAISGLNAPLPTPYGELLLRRKQEQDESMANFINLFNSRLLGISYQISKRRFLNLQDHKNGNCMFVKTLAAFCGENFEKMNRRFSRIAYLFWTKEKSAAGLESAITALFGFTTKVDQFQMTRTKTSNDNRMMRGALKLGINSELGTHAYVANLKIKINLTHPSFAKIYKFITSEEKAVASKLTELEQLKYVVCKYAGNFYFYDITITPQRVPPLRLGKTSQRRAVLGLTAWLPARSGVTFDSATILI